MSAASPKNNILKKIRLALTHSTPIPFPKSEGTAGTVFQPLQQDIVVEFAEQFTGLQGKFDYCINRQELEAHFQKLCYQNQCTKIFCSDEQLSAAWLKRTDYLLIRADGASEIFSDLLGDLSLRSARHALEDVSVLPILIGQSFLKRDDFLFADVDVVGFVHGENAH